jgi:lipid II:glycine glycyltransferase (peptidoglycan interpeptide bridge formation enzyme)
VYSFNPLEDSRWTEFVQRHPLASVFHSSEWLEVLRRTYGYESVAYSTSPPKAILTNAVVFSRVNSWLTGRRLVSLPFADHCEPLVERAEDRAAIFLVLRDSFKKGLWKSIEMRLHGSDARGAADLSLSDPYCFHTLDLRPSLAELFQGFHKNCIQRKIRRAEREGLSYEEGRSDELLEKFYRLLLLTRRRHSLPPQPIEWFRNLIACMGDRVTISVASRNRRALGSLITLRHNDALVYKYGASDERFHQFGTMPFLFWKMIQNGKETGIREIDLGRSDLDGAGLMTFKDRLGATRSTSTYLRYAAPNTKSTTDRHLVRAAEQVFDRLPDKALVIAGRLLYRHVG